MVLLFTYQSGEFNYDGNEWWVDLLVALAGAIVGTGGSILVFYLKQRSDRRKEEALRKLEKEKEEFERKEEKRKEEEKKIELLKEKTIYFESVLTMSIEGVKRQSDEYELFKTAFHKNPISIPVFTSIIQNDIERVIYKLNLEEHYHAFIFKFSTNGKIHFNKIISDLDYFSAAMKEIEKGIIEAKDDNSEFYTKFKNLLIEIKDITAETAASLELNYIFPEAYSICREHLKIYYSDPKNNTDIDTIINVFASPYLSKLSDQIKLYKRTSVPNPRIDTLIEIRNKLRLLMQQYSILSKYNNELLKSFADKALDIKERITKLENIVAELK